jgi:hypothetical protein
MESKQSAMTTEPTLKTATPAPVFPKASQLRAPGRAELELCLEKQTLPPFAARTA